MTSCWSVGDYVLANVSSSLVWACLLGIGGGVLYVARRRFFPRQPDPPRPPPPVDGPWRCAMCGRPHDPMPTAAQLTPPGPRA